MIEEGNFLRTGRIQRTRSSNLLGGIAINRATRYPGQFFERMFHQLILRRFFCLITLQRAIGAICATQPDGPIPLPNQCEPTNPDGVLILLCPPL
jgi:hypothetical protein